MDPREVNRPLLDEFNIQEDVIMYIRLPDYDDLRGFDLPNVTDLEAISKRICVWLAKPPWLTSKNAIYLE